MPVEPQAANEALPSSWVGAVSVCGDHRALACLTVLAVIVFNNFAAAFGKSARLCLLRFMMTVSVGPWQFPHTPLSGDD